MTSRLAALAPPHGLAAARGGAWWRVVAIGSLRDADPPSLLPIVLTRGALANNAVKVHE